MTRPTNWIIAALCLCCLATNLSAQDFVRSRTLRRFGLQNSPALRAPVVRVAQPIENSPSDLVIPAEPLDSMQPASLYSAPTCDNCVSEVCCCPTGPLNLFPPIGNGWQFDGWFAFGVTANADRPRSIINGPVTFNDRARFQGNQIYGRFGRAADTGGCGWAWGGQLDVMWGSDFVFTQAVGLELDDNGNSHWSRSGEQYGVVLPQFFGEVAYNNLRARFGHFYTIIGHETVTAPDNFFYSHAYTMQYGEPFTHTGGLLSWDFNCFTFHGGIVNGWDKFDAVTDRASFLSGVTWTGERASIAVAGITGKEDGAQGSANLATRTMYSVVISLDVTDRLQYIVQHDNGWNDVAGPDQEWYGINQYLLYTINDCWKIGLRAEWFRDDDGTRLSNAPIRAGGLGYVNAVRASMGQPPLTQADYAGNYYNMSLGLNWTPAENIVFRPEARFDWSDSNNVAPFDDTRRDSQFLGAFDIIIHY